MIVACAFCGTIIPSCRESQRWTVRTLKPASQAHRHVNNATRPGRAHDSLTIHVWRAADQRFVGTGLASLIGLDFFLTCFLLLISWTVDPQFCGVLNRPFFCRISGTLKLIS